MISLSTVYFENGLIIKHQYLILAKGIIMMTKNYISILIVLNHLMLRIYETLFTITRIFDLFYYQRRYRIEGIEQKILDILDNKFRN